MCQDIEHGGHRCQVDTTPQRRYRRKTTTLLKKYGNLPGCPSSSPAPHQTIPYEELPAQIVQLKTMLHSAPPENTTLEEWDTQTEELVSGIGESISEEVERRVHVNVKNVTDQLHTAQQEIIELNLSRDKILHSLDAYSKEGIVVPDLKTMPGKMKYASLNDEDKTVVDAIIKLKNQEAELKQAIYTKKEDNEKLSYQTLTSMKEKYWEVLSELRDFGGNVNSKTDEADARFVNSTLGKYYPSEWIKLSNSAGSLTITSSETARPEYRSSTLPLSYASTDSNIENVVPAGQEYTTQPFETDTQQAGKAVFYADTANVAGDHIVYRKELTSEEKNLVGENVLQDLPAGTLYHEFGHRLEQVLPNNILVRQEKAFLMRRAGKSPEEWNKNIIPIGRTEFAHNGAFVAPYVGKEYFDGKRYEVFTTGIQALYSGEYGGLLGLSPQYKTPDLEHRNFVLGILATV